MPAEGGGGEQSGQARAEDDDAGAGGGASWMGGGLRHRGGPVVWGWIHLRFVRAGRAVHGPPVLRMRAPWLAVPCA